MDPETMTRVPADGETLGEVMFRGNVVMKGYLKNPKATAEAFRGGWFHSGDLGVMHTDQLHPAQGPLQGHHHFRGREYFLHRSGGLPLQAPGHSGGGGGGQARREMGRDALRLCGIETGEGGERGRYSGVVPQRPGEIQSAETCGVHRAAEDQHGEDSKVQAAGEGEGRLSMVQPHRGFRMLLIHFTGVAGDDSLALSELDERFALFGIVQRFGLNADTCIRP